VTIRERIEHVLQAEAKAILSVNVTPAFETAAYLIAGCRGKVVTMGMGKAGIVARKMAATFCATRTPSVYLHPGDAAHGDLGVIEPHDVMVAFSTSGKTVEVLEAIASAKRLGVSVVIGITAHPDAFAGKCDVLLNMGVVEEPCPLGLAPSASSAAMLAIGDAIALSVMELKGVSRRDFGLRHRGGYLGSQTREAVEVVL
jgi:arabinose-5-phosphate isomerase